MPDLTGRVVVVTGATGAIGRATVRLLRQHGASVAALGRNSERLAELDQDAGVVSWPVDVRDQERLSLVANRVAAELGPVSGVLAFAGGNGFPVATADETLEHWRQVIEDDLTATFQTVRAFLDQLRTHRSSAIVTMASSAALRAGKSSAAYAAAKAGVIGLTRHLAGELLPDGVRVNCIAPGAVDNDRFAAMPEQQRLAMTDRLPMKRLGTPEDVAHAALYLATSQSAYTTGTVLELGAITL